MVLFLALVAQAAPEIERAELRTGGAFRPSHWTPLEVRVRSDARLQGEVVVRTDVGFSVVHAAEVGPDRPPVVIPVLALGIDAPLEVVFRSEGRERARLKRRSLGRGLYQSERLVGAAGSVPDERTVLFDPRDMPLSWLEGVDAVVGSAPAGYVEMGGIVAADLPEALHRLEKRGKFESRWFETIDPALCGLASSEPWIATQRRHALWFSLLYLLASLAVLMALARWRPSWGLAGALALGGVGAAVAMAGFPRGTVSIARRSCEVGGARLDIYSVSRPKSGMIDAAFPSLVKPVYSSYGAAVGDRFELHVEGAHSKVVGFSLQPGEIRIFTSVTGDPQPRRVEVSRNGDRMHMAGILWDAGVIVDGRGARFGDLQGVAEGNLGEVGEPEEPYYRYFRRKGWGGADFAYGWREGCVAAGFSVTATDLAEERRHPTLVLQPLNP